MRRPRPSEFDDGDGNGVDYDAYEEKMDDYADAQRDEMIDRQLMEEEEEDENSNNSNSTDSSNSSRM